MSRGAKFWEFYPAYVLEYYTLGSVLNVVAVLTEAEQVKMKGDHAYLCVQ